MSEQGFRGTAHESDEARVSRLPFATSQECLGLEQGVAGFYLQGNLAVLVWLDAATLSSADLLVQATHRTLRRELGPLFVVNYLTPRKPMPDQEVRRRLMVSMREMEPHLAATALVLNGDGFWAGAVRAMINGLRLMSSGAAKIRVDATLVDTAGWLPEMYTRVTGMELSSTKFRQVVDTAVQRAQQGQ